MTGYYYLHTNGDLIFKPSTYSPADFDSDFVVKWWPFDISDRMDAWRIILEAIDLQGVTPRVKELATKWHMDFDDSRQMLARHNGSPSESWKRGLEGFITGVLGMTTDDYWNKLKATTSGSGEVGRRA